MKLKLSHTVSALIVGLTATLACADEPAVKIAPGPFKGDMDSLSQYECPAWFRDAKFGIWAHWGPQCVPMMGDWYAKKMYQEGSVDYKDHMERWGHPSKHGYKDIIPMWKAEKWDPDRLMALYKKAGAKYFVSMGTHHDNFFLWNSKIHKWNAVQMGPHRDVVGDWQAAAKKQGLQFGVSEHLGASFTWFQVAHKSDTNGPMAGVAYDGADPKFEDLYHFPADPDDKGWYSKNPRWHKMWFERIRELVDNYHPDLLYTDGGVPFSNEVGMSLIAHYYNNDPKREGSHPQVVYNCKQNSGGRWVEDLERGVMGGVNPNPWQTDTSIGDWFYNKNWKFRKIDWVIHMLVDIVSKNGNLLLNVVQRPDGTLDPEVEEMLGQLANWTAINGEAIYGTRPWIAYGEGITRAKGGHFKEDFNYTAADIRFTTKGDTLYAFAMDWPENRTITIRSLAKNAKSGNITKVSMLGCGADLKWTHDEKGLTVTFPEQKPCEVAFALKINGERLNDFTPALPIIPPAAADKKGNFKLGAVDAETHGKRIKSEHRTGGDNIGFWDNASEWVSWKVSVPAAQKYEVVAIVATPHNASEITVEFCGEKLTGRILATGAFDTYKPVVIGKIEAKPGEQVLSVRPANAKSWKAVNLREIKLQKTK